MDIKIDNCVDCSSHIVSRDPDPNDWFNDDDVKVTCDINKKQITSSCRPYNIRKECDIPTWCPKNEIKYIQPKEGGYKELFITEDITPAKGLSLKLLYEELKEYAKTSGYTHIISDYYFSEKHSVYLKRNQYPSLYVTINGVDYEYTEAITQGDKPLSSEVFDDVKLIGSK